MRRLAVVLLLLLLAVGLNYLWFDTDDEPIAPATMPSLVPEAMVDGQRETAVPTLAPSISISPTLFTSAIPTAITQQNSPFLDQLARDTWAYISAPETTTNHLPWSWYSETISGGDYANTAEIGFYALSWLAAYDRQAAWSPGWTETEAEVTAVLDQLRAWQTGSQTYQPHGPNAYQNTVFYQWYWISWNPPVVSGLLKDRLVPSVDNAWLAVSLITIGEYADAHDHTDLAAKADAILADIDFRLWFDIDTNLFSWGGIEDPQDPFVADIYSNENRIINFTARALGHITAEEFQASLAALSQPVGIYNDITVDKMAYDGSYFTYTSPALFIREMDREYGRLTIDPATEAQIAYAADQGYEVWGLSDSYDVGGGGYVQQGAPPTIATDPPETRSGLVTPHASALALITDFSVQAESNLQAIADNYDCAYHPTFGFYDSVMADFLADDYGQCSYRFSVLAQEWIFLSLVNYQDEFVWRYFYRNNGVRLAHQEMFDDSVIYLPLVIITGTSNSE
jgi:hypothetical protein